MAAMYREDEEPDVGEDVAWDHLLSMQDTDGKFAGAGSDQRYDSLPQLEFGGWGG